MRSSSVLDVGGQGGGGVLHVGGGGVLHMGNSVGLNHGGDGLQELGGGGDSLLDCDGGGVLDNVWGRGVGDDMGSSYGVDGYVVGVDLRGGVDQVVVELRGDSVSVAYLGSGHHMGHGVGDGCSHDGLADGVNKAVLVQVLGETL